MFGVWSELYHLALRVLASGASARAGFSRAERIEVMSKLTLAKYWSNEDVFAFFLFHEPTYDQGRPSRTLSDHPISCRQTLVPSKVNASPTRGFTVCSQPAHIRARSQQPGSIIVHTHTYT